jgi:hypothetical protein
MKIEAESKADHVTKPLEKMLQESLKNSDSVHALGFTQVKTLTLCIFPFIVHASCNRNSGSLVMQITALLLLLFVELEPIADKQEKLPSARNKKPSLLPPMTNHENKTKCGGRDKYHPRPHLTIEFKHVDMKEAPQIWFQRPDFPMRSIGLFIAETRTTVAIQKRVIGGQKNQREKKVADAVPLAL